MPDWRKKVADNGMKYNTSVSRHAVRIFDKLLSEKITSIEAPTYADLADQLGVPRKYLSRSIATLTRTGLLTGYLEEPIVLRFHPDRLAKSKNAAQTVRRAPTKRERLAIFEADGYRCGLCGDVFEASQLAVDHVIPACQLGADQPGNWVSMCHKCNAEKWDEPQLKFYRGKPVKSLGMRFKAGFHWPFINSMLRMQTRNQL